MAIKYVIIPEKKMTMAILDGTKYDAIDKIDQICRRNSIGSVEFFISECKNLEMPNHFKATVICHSDDSFDVEEGKRQAKQKLLKNYHNSFDKRVNYFKSVIKMFSEKINDNLDNIPKEW